MARGRPHLRCTALFLAPLVALGLAVLPAAALPAGALDRPLTAGTGPVPNSVLALGDASAVVPTSGALPGPNVAMASTPDGGGYWVATSGGGVFTFGDARFFGSMGATPLNQPIVAMAATPDGGGYWLVAADGGIFSFGDAAFYGSTGAMALNRPVVGMAAVPGGGGYWLVAADGGIFSFGDAAFYGSTGAMALNKPVVGMAAAPNGGGYWLVAADGGIFSFGQAPFYGSTGAITLAQPIVAMAATADGGGYTMVAADGGVFTFGDAPFYGSGVGAPINAPAIGIATRPGGYWIGYGQTALLSTPLGQEQTLAQLGYLPLTWEPAPQGFQWRWALPGQLTSQWVAGQYNMVLKGAIWAFEAQEGLPMDGQIGTAEINALLGAIADPPAAANRNGYTYALALKSRPEVLTVWHNGVVVGSTLANTGIPAAPTADGTFPVYSRLRSQIMTGTDPDGQHYADPVQWVAYFNGGDAVHYIARASYGYPQSLGCVEVPYDAGAQLWPYLTYGSLVTVAG